MTRGFCQGVLVALELLHMHDELVIYDEVMGAVGDDRAIIKAAIRAGTMKAAGLPDYMKRLAARRRLDARQRARDLEHQTTVIARNSVAVRSAIIARLR